MYKYTAYYCCIMPYYIGYMCRSELPRGLKGEYATACLLGLRVLIPPEAWMMSLVNVVFCQIESSATSRSLVQRSHTEFGVPQCDREASKTGRP
jgi:hypothetical protein